MKLLRTTDITSGSINWSAVPFCSKAPPDADTYLLRANDIVVSRAGSVGVSLRITEAPLPAVFASYLIRFQPHGIEPSYLAWFLKSPDYWTQVRGAAVGIALPNVNAKKLAAIRLPIPPLAEQRRIVAAVEEQLSRLDAAIESDRVALKRMETLLAATFDTATAGNWPRRSLGSMLREPLRNGVSARTSSDGAVRIVTLSAVTQDAFIEANSKLANVDAERVRDLWLEPGDVLIERSNTAELVGTAALYDGPPRWAIFPDLLIRVRTSDELAPEFLALFLKSRAARRYFRGAAKGLSGSMPKIGQNDIRELVLPVPTRAEQDAAVAEANRMLDLTSALRDSVVGTLNRARSLRSSILTAAFRGELVNQNPHEEPATVLLERIAAEHAAAIQRPRSRREKATA
jgi:type I restriction enzyme, S subunit